MPDFREENLSPRRFYRDPQHRIILGVCAGIADYFGFKRWAVRVIAVASLCFFMPFTLLVYLGLGLLTPLKPLALYESEAEEKFWREVRVSPRATLSRARHKFRELDIRLQRLERYVTSPRFDLDKEFRDLEDN